jgi:hypothetical protein
MADEADIISREDLNSNKNIFLEQQLYAMKIADIYQPDIRKRLTQGKKFKTVFPSPDTLYNREIVKEMDPGSVVHTAKNKVTKKKCFEEDRNISAVHSNTGNSNASNTATNTRDKINTITVLENKETISQESNVNETTSTSSKDDAAAVVINLNELKEIHLLFANREKSRFEFAAKNKNNYEFEEIPKFIKELIVKKVSRHKFTKNIKNSEDLLYKDETLETEYKKNNTWAQFIIENKTVNDDWEFIQDFDYINSLLLNTRKKP